MLIMPAIKANAQAPAQTHRGSLEIIGSTDADRPRATRQVPSTLRLCGRSKVTQSVTLSFAKFAAGAAIVSRNA